MLVLPISAVFLIWFVITAYLDHTNDDDFDTSKTVAGVLFIISLFAMIIFTCVGVYNQKYDLEDIKAVDRSIAIYETKTKDLTAQFDKILGKDYPNHEMKIFEGMTPENVDILFTKYPELKASITSINLVEEISALNADLYNQRLVRVGIVRDLNFRPRNPWFWTMFIPDPPANLKN